MSWQDVALVSAGVIGSVVAVLHGGLTQKHMVMPLRPLLVGARSPARIRRLVPVLLQFSTFNWLIGGLALIVSANVFPQDARVATSLLVGSSYLFAAVGNLWATRGRHPGWLLMALAVVLIVIGTGTGGAVRPSA